MWYAALDRKMAQAEKDPENSGLKKIISFFSNYIQMSHHLFKLYPNVPPLVCQEFPLVSLPSFMQRLGRARSIGLRIKP